MTDTFPPSPDSSALPGAPLPVIAPTMGLLLTGGGARAAYQVGVLEAIAQIRRDCGQGHGANPFPILTGTSAGAINAAALACGADQFDHAVRKLARVWSHLHTENVYHADALSMLRSGARWMSMLSLGWALTRWRSMHPRSLLDNAPLAALLQSELVPLARLPALVAQGHLRALSVTASSYNGRACELLRNPRPAPALGALPAASGQRPHQPCPSAGVLGDSLHLSRLAAGH